MRRAFFCLPLVCTITTGLTAFSPAPNKKISGPVTTEVLIAAAADLSFAMDSLVAVFSEDNPSTTVKTVYGSSGNFFQQISNGAPFDLFFSADIDYPRQLQLQHKTLSDVKAYGTGQLVLWSKKLDPAVAGINTLLDKAQSEK